ncbi:efflux RND transporter periplasmic adaptor subunit [Dyadobacter psychrotolerans]|uniref:Efflux RND transporter periplasmic adaptor subunit n=1 Tax=Dyadobacter psychrotolerans TaxID=2541721 RepID=A0A4R5DMP3_9BACT|nr:efflux RND transporter periplasmic adaptor subunit [Dyadobacter psychrotolerans]TDE11963.1 efflux RND transporter periplasmic adaptor subunit [Dyadobacter psychrotolerans]
MKKYQIKTLMSIAVLWTLWGCGKEEKKQDNGIVDETVISVKTANVESAVRSEPIRVAGTVASSEEARLSFKVGGIVSKVYVKEGQTVRKGQLLAVLDMTEIDAQVSQATYSAEKSERDMQRVKNMLKDTAATLEQLQNATTGYDVSQQNLKIAKFNQSYAKIVSPIDGTVTRKQINEGEFAGAGTPGLIIASNRRNDWVVRVGVSDKDWARLQLGDQANVQLDAYPEESFKGTITNLAQSADPASKLYQVEVRIDPAGKKFASGLYGKVELTASQSRNYAVIPVEAVIEGNGNKGFVFVNQNGKAKRIPIMIGYLDGDRVLVTSGLEGIKEVITSGSAFLTDSSALLIKN